MATTPELYRLPPHASDAEAGIIGCCLLSPVESMAEAQAVIKEVEFFYDLRHQGIWKTLCGLPADRIDIVSVIEALKSKGIADEVGGIAYLSEIMNATTSAANIGYWLEIVQEKFVTRKIIQTCARLTAAAYESKNPIDLLAQAEMEMLAIRPSQKSGTDIKALVGEAIDKLEHKYKNPGVMVGLSTGLTDLDKLSDGMHKGEMIVVAGFPSTGKTALAVNIIVRNALSGVPGAIFSAEMRPVQLVVRSLCSNAKSNYHHLNDFDLERLIPESAKLANSPLYIEAAHGCGIGQVQAMARRLKQKHNIQIMAVDYIQLLQGTGDNREQQISSISKGLKAIALELDIPVLALSQLTDDGKLRESRAIGQDADTVWKLENNGEWTPKIQPVILRVEKCRDGETGCVDLTFFKQFTRFENCERIKQEDMP